MVLFGLRSCDNEQKWRARLESKLLFSLERPYLSSLVEVSKRLSLLVSRYLNVYVS